MPTLRSQSGFTLIELLVVIAIVAILAAILFPVFAKAREKSRQTACMNNQRQIVTAINMYAQDHQETFPPDPGTGSWAALLSPTVYDCPTSSWKGTVAAPDYGVNGYLYSMTLNDAKAPERTIATSDLIAGTAGASLRLLNGDVPIDPRHSDGAIFSFLDGHVEYASLKGASSKIGAIGNQGWMLAIRAAPFDVDKNTVALLHLNETSGAIGTVVSCVNDASFGSGNGSIAGTGSATVGAPSVNTDFGTAYMKNFASGYPYIERTGGTTAKRLTGHAQDYTFECWVRWNGTGSGRVYVASGFGSNNGSGIGYGWDFALYASGLNRAGFNLTYNGIDTGSGRQLISATTLTWDPQKWYHIGFCAKYTDSSSSGCKFTFFREAADQYGTMTKDTVTNAAIATYAGGGGPTSNGGRVCIDAFPGWVDEIRVSNCVRY